MTRALTAATTAALAVVLGAPAVASAVTVHHADRVGDVQRVKRLGGPERLPHRRNGDIAAVTVRHTDTRLVVRTTFRRLFRSRHDDVIVTVTVPGGGEYDVIQHLANDRTTLFGEYPPIPPALSCPGLHGALSFRKGWTSVSVPRACLGDPRWVRVGDMYQRAFLDQDLTFYDNGFRAGGRPGLGTSRRVYAGAGPVVPQTRLSPGTQ